LRIAPEEGLSNFQKLAQDHWAKLSEADTRAKYIDPLFTRCLNWQESDIVREEHINAGYLDYVFRVRGKNVFVLEAKRSGVAFTTPITFNLKRRHRIGFVMKDRSVKDALEQARRYCIDKGTLFGIVSNGTQYIVFEAVRPGEDWTDANCIIFYNLDDIKNSFVEFWNILSKDAVENNSLVDRVSVPAEEFKFTRPVDNIHFRNEKQPRNDLSRYMAPIIGYAFQEITEPEKIDMLRQCYVYEKEFEEVDRSLRRYFCTDMPVAYAADDIKKIVQKGESAGVFEDDFHRYAELVQKDHQEPVIFLLLGGIGAGKTTFIHRFFNIVLTEKEQEKILWFYVGLRDAPTSEDHVENYIMEKILEDLSGKYRTLVQYVKEEFSLNAFAPKLQVVRSLFAILKALGYVICIVLDNVDQHISALPKFHEQVFLKANSLTKTLRTITILTLREESYYGSDLVGVFDAYYIQKYLISAPNFIDLIVHRLDYILDKLRLPEAEFRKLIKTNMNYGSALDDIRDFLHVIRDSILRNPKRGVSAFMKQSSGGDMRRALELFSNFLVSGNTKIDEILDKYRVSGSYQIAYHQFIRSIILGDYRYFSGEHSHLMNVFDFNVEHSHSHFLHLKILSLAFDRLTNESPIGRGYLSINTLRNEAMNISVNVEAVEDSLIRLAKYRLIMLDTRSRETLDRASHFKITEGGGYYLNALIRRFSYLDLVLADTPIADPDLVHELRRVIHMGDLKVRFDRTRKFLEYLREMENKELTLNPQYLSSPLGKHRFMSRIISGFEKDQRYILSRISGKQIVDSEDI